MKVKIEYKNRRMETVGIDEFEFDIYCQKLSQDLTGLLSDIESFFDNQLDKHNIVSDEYYKKVKHRIFDMAGAIKRLPENIVFDEDYEDYEEFSEPIIEKPSRKATLPNIFGLFKEV